MTAHYQVQESDTGKRYREKGHIVRVQAHRRRGYDDGAIVSPSTGSGTKMMIQPDRCQLEQASGKSL